MRKETQILFLVIGCLVALSFSTASFARPNDCIDECTPQCPCSLVCFYGGLTTCGAFTSGVCAPGLQAEPDGLEWMAVDEEFLSVPALQPQEQPLEELAAAPEEK